MGPGTIEEEGEIIVKGLTLWYKSDGIWKKKMDATFKGPRGDLSVVKMGKKHLLAVPKRESLTFSALGELDEPFFKQRITYTGKELEGVVGSPAINSDGTKIFYIQGIGSGVLYSVTERRVIYRSEITMTSTSFTARFLNDRLLAFSTDGKTIIHDTLDPRGIDRESAILDNEFPRFIDDRFAVFFEREGVAICRLPRPGSKPLGEDIHIECQHLPGTEELSDISLYRIDERRWLLMTTGENKNEDKQWVLTEVPAGNETRIEYRERNKIRRDEALKEEGAIYPFLYSVGDVLPIENFISQMPEVRKQTLEFLEENTSIATDVLSVVVNFIV